MPASQKDRVFSTIIPPPNAPPRFAISFQCARTKSHASLVPAGFRSTPEITIRLSCERTSGEIAYSKVLSSSLGITEARECSLIEVFFLGTLGGFHVRQDGVIQCRVPVARRDLQSREQKLTIHRRRILHRLLRQLTGYHFYFRIT